MVKYEPLFSTICSSCSRENASMKKVKSSAWSKIENGRERSSSIEILITIAIKLMDFEFYTIPVLEIDTGKEKKKME